MKPSTSTKYALLAVGYVAVNGKDDLVVSQAISRAYNIPLEYLLKIMQQLVKANVLSSKRGPRGGFMLARTPSKITMLEIIEAVEGPVDVSLALEQQVPKNNRFGTRATKAYDKILTQSKSALKKVKLSELL
jgi:Rrf2 family protein